MNMTTSISKLLTDIRYCHSKVCANSKFKLHIEITSDDKMVSLIQYCNGEPQLHLSRWYSESDCKLFDLELHMLLTQYLKLIS